MEYPTLHEQLAKLHFAYMKGKNYDGLSVKLGHELSPEDRQTWVLIHKLREESWMAGMEVAIRIERNKREKAEAAQNEN